MHFPDRLSFPLLVGHGCEGPAAFAHAVVHDRVREGHEDDPFGAALFDQPPEQRPGCRDGHNARQGMAGYSRAALVPGADCFQRLFPAVAGPCFARGCQFSGFTGGEFCRVCERCAAGVLEPCLPGIGEVRCGCPVVGDGGDPVHQADPSGPV